MRVLVIYAHPYRESYNYALLKKTLSGLEKNGADLDLLDLNQEEFDPVLSADGLAGYPEGKVVDPKVGEYQEQVRKADHLVFIFPIWWGNMPAILKGWIDKVFIPGFAYETQPSGMLKGLLNGKSSSVINTMNAPLFFQRFILKSPIKQTLIKSVLRSCGIKNTKWFRLSSVKRKSDEKRKKWLENVERYYSEGLK